MSAAIEIETGAQLLPYPRGPLPRNLSTYVAHSACSADLRARSRPHREAAERITITRGEHHDDEG